MSKKAQEEIVGFALIIVVVAVVLLIFLGFSLNDSESETVESYEAESFIQSMLQYTTECKNNYESVEVRDLIFDCVQEEQCIGGENPCVVLNDTVKGILEKSWPVGTERPIKGYELNIDTGEGNLILITEGNQTGNSKGTSPSFVSSGEEAEITFKAYY